MTLSGGAADKFGNLYEGCWTVRYLLYVMDEKYDSIRLEDPSPEGEGFEFSVRRETRSNTIRSRALMVGQLSG